MVARDLTDIPLTPLSTVRAEATLGDALDRAGALGSSVLLVLGGSGAEGLLDLADVALALRRRPQLALARVSSMMLALPPSLPGSASCDEAMRLVASSRARGLLVREHGGEDAPVLGLLALADLIAAAGPSVGGTEPDGGGDRGQSISYRRLFDGAPDMQLVVAADSGLILDANAAVRERLALDREALIGRHLGGLLPMFAKQNWPEQVAYCREAGSLNVETEIQGVDDRACPVDAGLHWIPGPPEELLIIAARELTPRMEAEARLRQSEARLVQAETFGGHGSWVHDIGAETLWWSGGVYRIFEVEAALFHPSLPSFIEAVHPDDREGLLRLYQDALAGKGDYDLVHRICLPSGRTKYLAQHCEVFRDDAGRPVRTMGVVRDVTAQEEMGRDLRARTDELQAMFDNSQVGIMLFKGYRVLERCNRRLAEILGYPDAASMIGLSMRDLHLSEDRFDAFGRDHYAPVSKHEQRQVEYQLRSRDGTPIWCSLSGKALDPGTPADLSRGVLWVVDDISARKTVEHALERERKLNQTILDSAAEGMLGMDMSGKIVFANRAALYILVCTEDEALGCRFDELLYPQQEPAGDAADAPPGKDADRLEALRHAPVTAVQQALQRGDVLRVARQHFRRGDGATFPVELSLAPMFDGKRRVGAVLSFSDLTARSEAEQALLDSEATLTALAETARDGIAILDERGSAIFWNTAAARMTGCDGVEAADRPLHELIKSPRLAQLVECGYASAADAERVCEGGATFELSVAGDDGIECPMELSLSSLRISGRWHALVVVRDLSERKRFEAAERWSSFQAGVAEMSTMLLHNIGNAVHVAREDAFQISAACDELSQVAEALRLSAARDHGGLAELQVEAASAIDQLVARDLLRRSERLGSSIEHVADIIRIQQDSLRQDTLCQRFGLAELLAEAEAMLGDSLQARGIAMTRTCDPAIGMVQLPRNQLLQALVNLLKNAYEATRDQSLADEAEPIPCIRLSAERDGDDAVLIQVEDTGVGLSQEQHEQLFQFGYTTKAGGSGFGLHSVANFVRSLGGTISANSDGRGKGCRFDIRLPRELSGDQWGRK